LGGNWLHIIFWRIFLEAAQIWQELAPHYFPADYLEAAQSSSGPRAASVFVSPSVILSVRKG
jgi:hypothetical protein